MKAPRRLGACVAAFGVLVGAPPPPLPAPPPLPIPAPSVPPCSLNPCFVSPSACAPQDDLTMSVGSQAGLQSVGGVIGTATVGLAELLEGRAVERTYDVINATGRRSGTVSIKVRPQTRSAVRGWGGWG